MCLIFLLSVLGKDYSHINLYLKKRGLNCVFTAILISISARNAIKFGPYFVIL